MYKRRDFTVAVAVFFLLLWALLTHSHVNSWNDASRLATAEALVHQGTWAIENTSFIQRTADYISWNGHFYSDKPPMLPFLTAGVYAVLHHGLGISFDFSGWCDPVSSPCACFALLCPQAPDWAYYVVTLVLIGLPSVLMLALFYRSTAFFDLPNALALPLTGALGLGTMVFPYSLVFNNHIPTGAALMLGFYALLQARTGKGAPERWLVTAGLATALAFTFDLLVAPFLAAFLAVALFRHRLRVWAFVVGALIPLVLLAILDLWLLGDPLPPSMHPAGFDYPGSAFATTLTGNTPSTDVLGHGVEMFFGERGLLTLNPVMALPLFGLGALLCQRRHRLWGETVAVASACAVVALSLIVFTPGFGGVSYGTRWLLDVTPVLFFFAACPRLYRPVVGRLLVGLLAFVSILSAWQGALSPWSITLSPHRLFQYAVSPVGRYLDEVPAGTALYATTSRVPYLPIFPVHAGHSRLRSFDVASGALPAGDPAQMAVYVLDAGDNTSRSLLETAFPQGRWEMVMDEVIVYQVPPGADRVRPGVPLEAEFDGRIRLVGCDFPSESLRAGDVVTVRLYWQALAPMNRPYTAFVHLLGPANPSSGSVLWAQDDHQPGRAAYGTERWFPGEIVVDGFQLVIPEDAPAGEYTVSTGFYDLVSGQRLARSDAQGDTATLALVVVSP
jgi:hypothetical protein